MPIFSKAHFFGSGPFNINIDAFAIALDNHPDVKLLSKSLTAFKIDFPIGTYNPDWAVLLERDGSQ